MRSLVRTRLGLMATALWVALGAVFFGVGGDDPSRISLVGTVTVDGKPLDRGTVCFFHLPRGLDAVSGGTFVQHGRFELVDYDLLVPGSYSVWICGQGNETEPLPERFNSKTELEVVIPRRGTTHLAFDLKR